MSVAGKRLFKKSVPVLCTTLGQTVIVEVPKGEKWLIKGIYLRNCTMSSGNLSLIIFFRDVDDVDIARDSASVSSESYLTCPNNVFDASCFNNVFPLWVYAGWKIVFYFGASGNKSGTAYYFIDGKQYPMDKAE